MRVTVYFVMVCVLMLSVSLKADLPVDPICTASGEQVEPDIDGDWIIWQDARSGVNIYGYTLAEPNEIAICTFTGDQKRPAISGNTVIWQDERSSQRDIYGFDLSLRGSLDLPNLPRADSIYQQYPDISGHVIVYQHNVGVYNIYQYNMDTQVAQAVSSSSYAQSYPAIDGTIVVWMENRGSGDRVYWRDISTQNPAAAVGDGGYKQYYPAVSGNLLVWAEEITSGDMDIYGCYLPNGQRFLIAGGAGEQNRPAVSGTIVVWQEKLTGRSDYDILGVDLAGGSPFAIITTTNNDQLPAISGRRVVWQRGTSNFDIYTAVIPAPQPTAKIAVVSPGGGEQILAGTEILIEWGLIDGTPPTAVNIEYSTDNGTHFDPVVSNIPFDNHEYLWLLIVDDIDSTLCKIRVSAADDASISDVSEVFTIFQCSPNLTADLTGDCFVGLDDFAEFAVQWLTCGNPYDANWCVQ